MPSDASPRHFLGSGVFLIVVFSATLGAFDLLWRRSPFEDFAAQPGGWLGAILIVAGSAVIHELLHALGWMLFAGVSWRSISVRPTWQVMGFKAHVDVPVRARTHRLVAALPAILLGGLPILAGLALGRGLVVFWGLFFLLECFADIGRILSMPNVANVESNPW